MYHDRSPPSELRPKGELTDKRSSRAQTGTLWREQRTRSWHNAARSLAGTVDDNGGGSAGGLRPGAGARCTVDLDTGGVGECRTYNCQ
jgi:hypothetical protein